MLRILRGGQRWLTALFIVAIGGVFVFFLGLGGPLSGRSEKTLVEVGPYRFGAAEFERVRSRIATAVQGQMGEGYNERELAETLDGLAARELVDTALLALAAEDLGLTVTKKEIEQNILLEPYFRDESGRFDRAAFEGWVDYAYGSQRSFLQDRRLFLLAYKMRTLLTRGAHVSDGEVRELVRSELEEMRIAFVAIDGTAPGEEIEIDAAAIEHALATRSAELEERYAEQRERYDVPEQVRARHILVRVERGADEAQLEARRALAQELRDQLAAGADFAELARARSDDLGTRDSGGDLGFFRRGQMVQQFEAAAFALEPGQLSELVRSDFGFHIIRVEEHRAAVLRTFEEVREELARELLREEALRARARERAERLASAILEGASLETAAAAAQIPVQRSGTLTRRPGSVVPGLGPAPELMATAFALAPGESSPRIFEVGNKLALVQLLERKEPQADAIEARMAEVRERLENAKRTLRADDWLDERREALLDAKRLAVNLESLGRR
ncbi:MAG: peptidylprolyl isomerase [Myxococcales bacterium]|nr:peptidylprolyl isomerase [Myxococcales bacterium]MDH5305684.1 peptidylprolyl isomerase [Myxococcales bacterium]MDH5567904.1 peptidylprolyl isomerase [Myxococcales bacterium]